MAGTASLAQQISVPLSLRKQDWAYRQLRDWILTGVLRPGRQLGQEHLAAELGISRIPLRHALSRLASEGLVVDRPHQQWTVAAMSIADARDVYHGRAALEVMLASTAARSKAREEALAGISSLLEEQRKAAAEGDRARVSLLDRRFHGAVYLLAEMPASVSALDQLRSKSDRYVALYLADTDRAKSSLAEHGGILDALREEVEQLRKQLDASGNSTTTTPAK